MHRFVRYCADSARQPVEVAAASQRSTRPQAVAIPNADAADEAESRGEASSVEGEYSHTTGLLDELAKEQPAAGQWAAQLPSDAEVRNSFDAYLRHRARQLLGYIATLTTRTTQRKDKILNISRYLQRHSVAQKQARLRQKAARQLRELHEAAQAHCPDADAYLQALNAAKNGSPHAAQLLLGFHSAGPHSEQDGDVACAARTLERQAGAQERCGTEKQSEGHQRRCLAVVAAESRKVSRRCSSEHVLLHGIGCFPYSRRSSA